MDTWLEDLLALVAVESPSKHELKQCLDNAVGALGYQYYSFGYQKALPLNRPAFSWINNYPDGWMKHYIDSGYMHLDPRVTRARRSSEPFLWRAELFKEAKPLWDELEKHGLSNGCTLSVLDSPGGISMFSVSRTAPIIESDEVAEKQLSLQRIAQLTHAIASKMVLSAIVTEFPRLTHREVEVMKWCADGKSAQDIAQILHVSKNTVDFHIKNCIVKMDAPNKTAAVMRAMMHGLLS